MPRRRTGAWAARVGRPSVRGVGRPALLLDIGGVVLRSGHEVMADLERQRPELAGWTARRGTLGPAPDPSWDRLLAGELTERAYWAERAAELGPLVGRSGETTALMELLYPDVAADSLFRPEAMAVMRDARVAGVPVAALTNDLAAFHGEQDLSGHPVWSRFDVVIDGSVTGVLKPDPRAYAAALEALDRSADDVVFLDDIPVNQAGGRAAGLHVVPVDLARPGLAFATARELLGLAREAA